MSRFLSQTERVFEQQVSVFTHQELAERVVPTPEQREEKPGRVRVHDVLQGAV